MSEHPTTPQYSGPVDGVRPTADQIAAIGKKFKEMGGSEYFARLQTQELGIGNMPGLIPTPSHPIAALPEGFKGIPHKGPQIV